MHWWSLDSRSLGSCLSSDGPGLQAKPNPNGHRIREDAQSGRIGEGRRGEKMPTLWLALKKSLHCKSNPSEVHEPRSRGPFGILLVRKRTCRSSCSKSIANLKDVIHGGRRQIERHSSCSPRSIGSNEFLNPIAHEVVLSDSRCELKITGFGNYHEGGGGGGEMGSAYVGTLTPGTPGPRGRSSTPSRKVAHPHWECSSLTGAAVLGNGGGANDACVDARSSSTGTSATFTCHRCGEQFGKWEGLEAHHQSKHAVTELLEGDSSRKIVEIICKASWLKSESTCGRLERVLKVHNMQNTLTQFEEYREMVKARASKLPKKHPRCLADGNELLRFYATTVYCSLGVNGSSNVCNSNKCNICRILRFGFSKKEMKGGLGMFTTSTSGRALESIQLHEDHPSIRKALLICRVIAGRVHKPTENLQNMASQFGFDSVAGKVGPYSSIEELYLLDTRALLPCFVVICKP